MTGASVVITGSFNFAGRVLVANKHVMIVAIAQDRSITLRRNPASTTPDQWTYRNMPVNVEILAPGDEQ